LRESGLLSGIITILREVRDPRQVNAQHDLADILFVALACFVCGGKTCVDMADFAKSWLRELREIVDLEFGAPSHDTFSRVFRLLDPEELSKAFGRCMEAVGRELGLGGSPGVVAIDGKALRRGYEAGRAFMPPLMVNVFDAQTRLSLAQARAPGGNEIKAGLDLLKAVVLKGCTLTADALYCRSDVAEAVRAQRAHYALALKANQPLLLAEAQAAFARAGDSVQTFETREAGHGRLERRSGSVAPASWMSTTYGFPGLAAIGRIETERTTASGKTTLETRYVALSRRMHPREMLEVVRTHWTVENQLHWPLDVVFYEDDARSRKDYAPENLAVIRRLAFNILRAHPDTIPTGRKMRRAALDKDFFFELFAYMR
jgi:predicted transposase YbfD/YdcC